MSRRNLLVHCNAGGDYGMGHLMRCLAILEEANSRGWAAQLVGDLAEPAVEQATRLLPALEVTSVPREQVPGRIAALDVAPDVVHLDSYWQEADALPPGGWLLSNMQDGDFGVRAADLAIDANMGAEDRYRANSAAHLLLGVDAVAIRRQVLEQRHQRTRPSDVLRVLVVLGGTDPFGLTDSVVTGLGAIRTPLTLTVVTPPAQREALEVTARASRHEVKLVPFLADLPSSARNHDLVITAAGTSIWDFACMGVPMAVICVADNQKDGYAAALDAGMAIGLGEPPHADLAVRLGLLDESLGDHHVLRLLAARGRDLVDGLGTWRIVSAWEQLLSSPPVVSTAGVRLRARLGTIDDAALLLQWRNDPATRQGSRSSGEVTWDEHVRWISSVLASDVRQLYIVEEDGVPVGTVRWDHLGRRDWEVSITLAPSARGRGLASPVLQAGEAALTVSGPVRLTATVHVENAASRRLFERAGYLPLTPPDEDGFATSARWRVTTGHPTSVAYRG